MLFYFIMKSKKRYVRTKRIRDKKTRKGGTREREELIEKRMRMDQFRRMFMEAYENITKSIKTNNNSLLKESIKQLDTVYEKNKLGLDTLIPVTHQHIPIDKYTYNSTTPILRFEPVLVILFHASPDSSLRIEFVKSFMKNGGKLNLTSNKGNISALSQAIELEDKPLINFLISNKANKHKLSQSQKIKLEELLKREMISKKDTKSAFDSALESIPNIKILNLPKSSKNAVKLQIPMELSRISEEEPEFWKPIFEENEMTEIKTRLNTMMRSDCSIKGNEVILNGNRNPTWEASELWSVCKINKSIIPTYSVPIQNKRYEVFQSLIQDLPDDFARYQILLCAALLVFGIISKKMEGQDYNLLFKGGKAIQLALSRIPNTDVYDSEDIDVLIVPHNVDYHQEHVKNLAGHVSYLVKWFLNDPEFKFTISVQEPITDRGAEERIITNPSIFKLSYVKHQKKSKYDYKTHTNTFVDDFRQFSDIDFGEITPDKSPFFANVKEYQYVVKELNQSVLFRCPNIGSLLDEKIYYYSKYAHFWEILYGVKLNTKIDDPIIERMYRDKDKDIHKIKEKGYENITPNDCNRYLEKFKRAILALNKGLQKQRFPKLSPQELVTKEIQSIKTRLNDIQKDEPFKERIVQSLYS